MKNLRLRKPATLSLLYRQEEGRYSPELTVTMLAGFRLNSGADLLDESVFWKPVKELDTVPFDLGSPKPFGEFLIAGDCYSPGGQMTLACPAQARVGDLEKNLVVFGDRYWTNTGKITFPAPFRKMELAWNRSFGGLPDQDNSAGRGLRPVTLANGKTMRPLANIENPHRLPGSTYERQRPVGFAPEGLDWPSRRSLAGSPDEEWLGHRWPEPPADASPGLFQLAPVDQRFPGFIHGDEQVVLRNMHPSRPCIESQLPGRRCRCFLGSRSATDSSSADEHRILEMQCSLDTLWLFPGHETGILIWRTQVNAMPEWNTDDLYLAATLEPLGEQPEEATTCYRGIIGMPEAAVEEVSGAEPEPEDDVPSKKDVTRDSDQEAMPKIDPAADVIARKTTEAMAKLTPLLASFGISAEELMRQPPASKSGKGAKSLTPARLEQRAAHLHKKLESTLLGTGLAPEDLKPDVKTSRPGKNRGARIAKAIAAMQSFGIVDEKLFAEMRDLEQQADLVREGKNKHPALAPVKPGSNLPLTSVMSREEVLAAHARGESLAGLNLGGLDLSGVKLDNVDLRDTILEGVNFSNTSLQGADLSGALLSGVDCSKGNLSEAKLTNCVATGMMAIGTDFSRANLEKARFDRGDFSRAGFAEVKATRAGFTACILVDSVAQGADLQKVSFKGADCSTAHFSDADLRRADFNRALMDGADFRNSNMEGAWFAESEGADVLFNKANLSRSKCNESSFPGADFSEAKMSQAAWSESVFNDSCLRRAMLDRAMLVHCDFRRADFSRASLRRGNLMHSDLRQASLYRVNGFKARFRHARLEESNCCDANLYGADLYKAALLHTQLDGANLDATLFAIKLPV